LYLIGTSEVPITSYHSDEILDLEKPKFYVAFSACFRREA
jgi:seryl-tRNA synthetase